MKRWTIIILAIGLIAGALAVFYNQNHNPAEPTASQTAATTDFSEGGKYLYVKEWGVRFRLPENLQGEAIYGLQDQTVYLTSKTLAGMPNSTCVVDVSKNQYGGRVLITRTAERKTPESELDKQLEGQWYRAANSGGGVCSAASDGSAETAFVGQMINAFRTMEVVQ